FFFSSRRRHTRFSRDWSSDVCSSDLFALRLSRQYAEEFRAMPLADETVAELRRLASESLAEQERLEQADTLSFEEYLEQYFAQRSEERRVGKGGRAQRRPQSSEAQAM